MSNRTALGVIAGLIMLLGLAVGLWPHSIPLGFKAGSEQATTMSCGSAFAPNTGDASLTSSESALVDAISGGDVAVTEQDLVSQCDDAVGTPRIIAFTLVGVAVLVLLFLLLTGQHTPQGAASAATEGDQQGSQAPPAS